MMHGSGKLTWPEGSTYDGTWVANEMQGQGRFDSAFQGQGAAMQGLFYRNCFRQYDGKWVDVFRLREQHRAAFLCIGAMPGAQVPVLRCTPDEVHGVVAGVLRDNRVPLVIADTSCPFERSEGSLSQPPLSYLEQGDRGCNESTTIHINYAAVVRR